MEFDKFLRKADLIKGKLESKCISYRESMKMVKLQNKLKSLQQASDTIEEEEISSHSSSFSEGDSFIKKKINA